MSNSENLKRRVEAVLAMAITTISPLSEAFVTVAPTSHEEATTERETVKSVVIPKEEALKAEEDISNGEIHSEARDV